MIFCRKLFSCSSSCANRRAAPGNAATPEAIAGLLELDVTTGWVRASSKLILRAAFLAQTADNSRGTSLT